MKGSGLLGLGVCAGKPESQVHELGGEKDLTQRVEEDEQYLRKA
jgi:hypothetical protein